MAAGLTVLGPLSRPRMTSRSHWPGQHLAALSSAVRRHPILAAFGAMVAVSLPFLLFPALDLAASRLFYAEASGFSAATSSAIRTLRKVGVAVQILIALLVFLPLLVKLAFPESRLLVRPRTTLFVLATYAVGPGLIVNALLKEHWGRARPRDVLEFGGTADFTPVWHLSQACGTNCSFVSGEGASAFFVVALVFIAPPAWRRVVLVGTLLFAAVVSYGRLAMGGHFLSDVLLSWAIVLVVMVVFWRLLLIGLPRGFDTGAEAALARAGRALRRGLSGLRTDRPRL